MIVAAFDESYVGINDSIFNGLNSTLSIEQLDLGYPYDLSSLETCLDPSTRCEGLQALNRTQAAGSRREEGVPGNHTEVGRKLLCMISHIHDYQWVYKLFICLHYVVHMLFYVSDDLLWAASLRKGWKMLNVNDTPSVLLVALWLWRLLLPRAKYLTRACDGTGR